MSGPRFCILRIVLLAIALFQCLTMSACQTSGEPYASPARLNPHITVTEIPPRPLSSELVSQQALPIPVQVASIPKVVVEPDTVAPAQVTQPPALLTGPAVKQVSHAPKTSGFAVALEHFLEHRNDDAITALRGYPADDQDAALVMLPMLARMEQGETWLTLNGPQKLALLESLRGLIKRLSKTAPLVLQHVTLVDKQPERYGEVKPRGNGNYYPEEYVGAYAELVNLHDFINPEGLYNVRLEVTLELHGLNDKIYYQASCPFQKAGSIGPRTDYHVAMYFNLPKDISPGGYQLVISVLDRDTNRTAKQALPLQILDPKSKPSSSRRRT